MSDDKVSNVDEYIANKVSEILAVLDGTAFCYVDNILDDVKKQCSYTIMNLKPIINRPS